jgi:hypothetical protein
VIDAPPIRFRRAAGMLPLPIPVGGGSIKELRPFLNVQSDDEFVLVVAWILAALRDCGPYPVLVLLGDHGAAKTTSAKILRTSVDPNKLPLRTLPRDEHDMHIAATNAWVVGYDNLSFLLDWISDTLCRLSGGGGFGTRQLYTDQDEVLFDATRPSLLNGIEEVVTRPDLADRAIFLTFVPIPDDKRQTEKELWPKFLAAQPRILGALLDAMATGLKRLPEVRLQQLPRMADFAIWITACEPALWQEGTFMRAYTRNIDEAVDTVISASLVADTVRAFMTKLSTPTWTGTATDLLDLLGRIAGEKAVRSKIWPTDAIRLSGRLRRVATFLRKVGIEISIDRIGRERTRNITIAYKEANCTSSNKDEGVPVLSDARIRELANDCLAAAAAQLETTGAVDRTTLERQLREKLAAEGVPSAAVETELGRVIEVVSTLCTE